MDIDHLRLLCKPLQAVTEDIKWDNDLCFSVGGKMFCVAALEPPLRISFKVPDDDFEELVVCEGFMPAPYMARAKWVTVTDVTCVKPKDWPGYIQQSYALVAKKLSRKLRIELGIQ